MVDFNFHQLLSNNKNSNKNANNPNNDSDNDDDRNYDKNKDPHTCCPQFLLVRLAFMKIFHYVIIIEFVLSVLFRALSKPVIQTTEISEDRDWNLLT